MFPNPGEAGYLPETLTAEHVGWLKALVSEFERIHDDENDPDPRSTVEMLCWCRDAVDRLSRIYVPCSECGDLWAVDGMCENCQTSIQFVPAAEPSDPCTVEIPF